MRSSRVRPAEADTPALDLLVGVCAALVPAAIGIAYLGRYGWDRDELYFLAASHHLAAGYVDYRR